MEQLTEYIGYAASLAVLIAFLMKNMRTLRIVNTVGCVLFIVYGCLLPSIPVIVTNAAIVVINLYYLLRKEKAKA
ncbi:MAG: YgjV family protein [Bacteroidota bacterium]